MCKCIIYLILLTVIQVKTDYILKQVLILSRHNLRAPKTVKNIDITPRKWPEWKEAAGTLTSKGAALEEDMGAYFASWLFKEKVIDTECPDEDNFYVYTNYLQRTVATGEAFVKGAFPFCKIEVHYKENNESTFKPFLNNNTEVFKKILTEDMENEIQKQQLNKSYGFLQEILNYSHSRHCELYKKCNLMTDKNNVINIKAGLHANVEGPLAVVKDAIDNFIMQYYYGYPIEQVAWGMLDTHKKRQIIAELFNERQNVIFNSSLTGAIDIAAPLIKYMSNILFNEKPKVTLLVGHNSKMYTLLKALKFKPYNLLDQYEKIPTGGKIVFQKWYNSDTGEDLLKIEYVYLTSDEIRNSKRISFDNPPVRTTLEIEGCYVDQTGFCLWDDFVRVLYNFLKI